MASNRKECRPSKIPGISTRPTHSTRSPSDTSVIVGRKVIEQAPGGAIWTSGRAPTVSSPSNFVTNGFHSAYDATAVSSAHTVSTGAAIRLTQAELFSGLLVSVAGGMLAKTQAGFEAMNDALRVRAENVAARTPEILQQ